MKFEMKQISEAESTIVIDTTARTMNDIFEELNDINQTFILIGDQVYQKSIIEYIKPMV